MASHPEIVKRAQAEIDEVIGSQRTPALEDRGNLPYIDCIVKEVYRYATYMYTLHLYLRYWKKATSIHPAIPIGKL